MKKKMKILKENYENCCMQQHKFHNRKMLFTIPHDSRNKKLAAIKTEENNFMKNKRSEERSFLKTPK